MKRESIVDRIRFAKLHSPFTQEKGSTQNMKRCKSCGALVRFEKTESGKSMPVDAEPDPKGNLTIVDEGGKTFLRYVGQPDSEPQLFDEPITRYRSHFVTCKDRHVWRRR